MKRKTRVFVSGPMTTGDASVNLRNAIDAAEELVRAGYVPIVPHLMYFWQIVHPHTWEEMMSICVEQVKACDILFRLPGRSRGAKVEEEVAKGRGMPVVGNITVLKAMYPAERNDERE
jgi:hypothetical protein